MGVSPILMSMKTIGLVVAAGVDEDIPGLAVIRQRGRAKLLQPNPVFTLEPTSPVAILHARADHIKRFILTSGC